MERGTRIRFDRRSSVCLDQVVINIPPEQSGSSSCRRCENRHRSKIEKLEFHGYGQTVSFGTNTNRDGGSLSISYTGLIATCDYLDALLHSTRQITASSRIKGTRQSKKRPALTALGYIMNLPLLGKTASLRYAKSWPLGRDLYNVPRVRF